MSVGVGLSCEKELAQCIAGWRSCRWWWLSEVDARALLLTFRSASFASFSRFSVAASRSLVLFFFWGGERNCSSDVCGWLPPRVSEHGGRNTCLRALEHLCPCCDVWRTVPVDCNRAVHATGNTLDLGTSSDYFLAVWRLLSREYV